MWVSFRTESHCIKADSLRRCRTWTTAPTLLSTGQRCRILYLFRTFIPWPLSPFPGCTKFTRVFRLASLCHETCLASPRPAPPLHRGSTTLPQLFGSDSIYLCRFAFLGQMPYHQRFLAPLMDPRPKSESVSCLRLRSRLMLRAGSFVCLLDSSLDYLFTLVIGW